MALQPNEKQSLAIGLGALAAIVLVYFGWGIWAGAFAQRELQLSKLQTKVFDQEKKVTEGNRAIARRKALEQRSLPSNKELALSLYQKWLFSLVSRVALDDPKVTPRNATSSRTLQKIGFEITGRGSLDQITRLLHEFYSTDHLHQIRDLTVKPIEKSSQLQLTMVVEGAILPTADRKDKLSDKPGHALALASLADYQRAIVGRNVFAEYVPPKPPEVVKKVEPVKVIEKPKEPSFDLAKLAYFTSIIVDKDGRPQIWLHRRNTNTTDYLFEGDRFEIGELKATVTRIDFEGREVEVEIDGKSFVLATNKSIGESLAEQRGGKAGTGG